MTTHYLMVTFQDFMGQRSEYRNLLWMKTGGQRYKLAYFEELDSNPATLAAAQLFVTGVPRTDKLKILLHGHGNAHYDFITNDAGTTRRNITELADLVCSLLSGRGATNPNAASKTVVVMVSCLFGRSNTIDLEDSSAWRLHDLIHRRGKRVDLVARTESVVQGASGLEVSSRAQTIGGHNRPIAKVPYTKVRCGYGIHGPTIEMSDYAGAYHGSGDQRVRQELWFYKALEDLAGHASDPTGNINHKRVHGAIEAYCFVEEMLGHHDPGYLYDCLRYIAGQVLAKPLPPGQLVLPGFIGRLLEPIGHRNLSFITVGRGTPNTLLFVRGVINTYP